MKINDGDSIYQIIFEIPLHKIPYHVRSQTDFKKESYGLEFKGVYSGVSRRNLPVANKIYLKEITLEEYVDEKFQPHYIERDTIDGQAEIEKIINEIPNFRKFFSLDAMDNYLEGGNIFFDNIISYSNPSESLVQLVGIYEMFRGSNSTSKMDCIKKFPLVINADGTAVIKHRHQSIHGKVMLYGKRLVLQFFNNGYKNFDLTILIPVFAESVEKINFLEGLILSASEYDEPYCCEVMIFRTEEKIKNINELNQEIIYRNDEHKFKELNSTSYHGFTNLGNYLLSRKFKSLRKMRRDWDALMMKKNNYMANQNRNSNYLNGSSDQFKENGHHVTDSSENFPLFSSSELLESVAKNLILLHFTKDKKALLELKTMCPLVLAQGLEGDLKNFLKEDINLTETQYEKVVDLFNEYFKSSKENFVEM